MKSLLHFFALPFSICLTFFTANATTYHWDSNTDGAWTTAANWSPSGVPVSGDAVIFDNGATAIVSSVPTVSLAELKILNGSNISLRATGAKTLTINGLTAPQFQIDNTSTCKFSGTSAITLSLATGVSGLVEGAAHLISAPHKILPTDAGALVFSNGSQFFAGDFSSPGFSGNPFGATGTAGVVIFQNGAKYWHNEGANPFGLAAPNSKTIFQTGSEYHYRPGGAATISAAGRSYANLFIENNTTATASGTQNLTFEDLNIEAGSSFAFSGNSTNKITVGGDIVAEGDLTLNAGSNNVQFVDNQTHTISGGANSVILNRILLAAGTTLQLQRNIENSVAATVNGTLDFGTSVFAGAGNFSLAASGHLKIGAPGGFDENLQNTGSRTFSATAKFTFNGSAPQISGANFPATVGKLSISNAVELSANVSVTDSLFLNEILSTGTNKVTLLNTAKFTRTLGHVEGNFEWQTGIGQTVALDFPVGGAGIFAPVNLVFLEVPTVAWVTAKSVSGDHPDISNTTFLTNQTVNRHWVLTSNDLIFNTLNAVFAWNAAAENDAAFDVQNAYAGHFDGSIWRYDFPENTQNATATFENLTALGGFQIGSCPTLPDQFYADADADAFGDSEVPILACSQPASAVPDSTDCNDADPNAFPGATEICFNGADENCLGGDGASEINLQIVPDCRFDLYNVIEIFSVGGGREPFQFSLDGLSFQDSLRFDTLPPGAFSVFALDADGCLFSQNIDIQPSTITSATKTDVACFGEFTGSASVTLLGGGYGSQFSYTLRRSGTLIGTGGILTGETVTVGDLRFGKYRFFITDSVGCRKGSAILEITQPEKLTVFIDKTDVSCGGAADGEATVSNTGGTMPCSFSWNDGQIAAQRSGLSGGVFTVTATDAAGCTASKNVRIIERPALDLTLQIIKPACPGEANGRISVLTNGGFGAKTALWNTGETTKKIEYLPAGDYSVTVTDALNCTAETAITLQDPPALEFIFIESQPAAMPGKFDVAVQATGGTGQIRFSHSKPDGTFTTPTPNPVFQNLLPGDYEFKLTDAKRCTNSETVAIPTTVSRPSDGSFRISKLVENQSLMLFPNPTDGHLNVIFPEEKTRFGGVLEIWDLLGKIWVRRDIRSGETLSVSALPAGNYFVSVRPDSENGKALLGILTKT